MATYPNTAFLPDSTVTRQHGRTVEYTPNGVAILSDDYDTEPLTFRLHHFHDTYIQAQALLAFYQANRFLAVDLPWVDGAVYSVRFVSFQGPLPLTAGHYETRVELVS